jgi:hypothetical protein
MGARIDKWEIKLESFCTSKETITKRKDNPQNEKKKTLLAIDQISD